MAYVFEQSPSAPGYAVDWSALRECFAWIRAMEGVPQDPTFHAEGDVAVHTRMVAEALAIDPQWRARDPEWRNAEFVAALLHDASKPETTVFEEGRWQSPHHARRGEIRARNLLWRGEAGPVPAFHLREHICRLVRFHGMPLRFIDKREPEDAVIAASMDVSFRALLSLTHADVIGRSCVSQHELLERIELFRTLVTDLGILDRPFPFESGMHRFMHFVGRKPISYVPFDYCWGTVICMSGLPGSGKTTWVQNHARDLSAVRMDDIREEFGIDPADDRQKDHVLKIAQDRATELLRQKTPFVWDATMLTKEFRASIIALMAKYGARVRLVYCEAPTFQETLRRNRNRERNVPEAVIDAMAWKLEVPSRTEAHEVVYVADLA